MDGLLQTNTAAIDGLAESLGALERKVREELSALAPGLAQILQLTGMMREIQRTCRKSGSPVEMVTDKLIGDGALTPEESMLRQPHERRTENALDFLTFCDKYFQSFERYTTQKQQLAAFGENTMPLFYDTWAEIRKAKKRVQLYWQLSRSFVELRTDFYILKCRIDHRRPPP